MTLDVTNFLLSLAAAMAAATTPPPPPAPPIALGTNLWVHDGVEGTTAEPYTVLRNYGGPLPEQMYHIERLSIQSATAGKIASLAMAQARQLYESLQMDDPAFPPSPTDAGNRLPRLNWTIPGKKIDNTGATVSDNATQYLVHLVIFSNPPGLVGRDGDGRWQASFNFDVRVSALAT